MFILVILSVIGIYLGCGLVFAVFFVIKGVGRIDEGAHGGSIGFRIIIVPGTMVFWPLLLKKWLRAAKENHAAPKDKHHDQNLA
ncbi:MAG TPA: hypothetical protein VE035_09450 [Puia sp.]|nr:hypothetical protein [Puia sp.]